MRRSQFIAQSPRLRRWMRAAQDLAPSSSSLSLPGVVVGEQAHGFPLDDDAQGPELLLSQFAGLPREADFDEEGLAKQEP